MTKEEMEIQALRRKVDELNQLRQMDMAEIVYLRRWIERLEGEKNG